MPTLTELRNEWAEAVAKAKGLAADGDTEAFNNAWTDAEDARRKWEAQDKIEKAEKALDEHRPTIADIRDPNDAADVPNAPKDVANANPDGYMQLSPGVYVPYATKTTEGYNRKSPASVQLPSIMARYAPDSDLFHEAMLQRKAADVYLRKGERAQEFNDAKLRAALNSLQEGSDADGGYLVPTDQRVELIHDPGAPGGVTRPISRVLQTARDGGTFPVGNTVTWGPIGELESPTESNPTFAEVAFTIRKSGVNSSVSEELLADSAVNVPAFLGRLADETSGRYEDQQAIEGDGATEPLGLRTTGAPQGNVADITDTITLSAPTLQEMLNAYFELPAQFRGAGAAWHTTSSFMARVTAISASGGQLWLLPDGQNRPGFTMLGLPVVMFDGTGWDDAATISADEELGAIGNFNFYWFIDRLGLVVRRDDSRYADQDRVLFRMRKRYDSFYAENEAFRIIKASDS